MSTYQRPLEPWGPVVPDQQIKPPVRFIRDNFQGTGQDSHTLAPAQDPAMWEALTNVMPITKGVIERRWGFTQLATGLGTANRIYTFQRDSDGLRTLVATGPGMASAFGEDGTSLGSIFSPTGSAVRSLTSRNYQYFLDGNAADLIKWDGATTSKWGIDINNVTTNQTGGGTSATTFGPTGAGTVADLADNGHAWTNPNNIKTTNGISASVALNSGVAGTLLSNTLKGTNLGMVVPTGTIVGIAVAVKLTLSGSYTASTLTANLYKNGVGYGGSHSATIARTSNSFNGTITLGGPTDLWGGSWTLADVAATGFGFGFHVAASPTATTDINDAGGFHITKTYSLLSNFQVDSVTVTIYTSAGGGTSTSSGTGVGITGSSGGGNVTLTIGRTYYLAFYNANTGHFSDISAASSSTGPAQSAQINLILATSNDPQVTHKYLLATADGNDPSILYQVAELVNGGGGDVITYTDNLAETTLLLNQIFLFTDQFGNEFGITLNDPPPSGSLCIKHQGRLWMAGVSGATHSIFFSKSIDDLTLPDGFIAGKYEEAWPGNNYFDISDGAESVNGLLSDGQTLYIGSQFHIRRLTGNDPINFSIPQIVHPYVGVLNQEAWQLVYTQGSPAGAMWLTPDFRVIQSDFNTYLDVGAPIQDILNNLQPTANTLAHGVFVAQGEYDLFILAVPYLQSTYCDYHLIYDLRHQKWFVWAPSNGSLALQYNVTAAGQPQWLFIDGVKGTLNQYNSNATDDNGTAFNVTLVTSWLGLGEPGHRKLINEVDFSGDPAINLTILGALTAADFRIPKTAVSTTTAVVGPLGTQKFFVAARGSDKYRYYKFIFQSNSLLPIVLNAYNVEVVPVSDL